MLFFILQVGLVQPTANWAKGTGVAGAAWPNVSKVGGLKFHRLPGHRGVKAQEYRTHQCCNEGGVGSKNDRRAGTHFFEPGVIR